LRVEGNSISIGQIHVAVELVLLGSGVGFVYLVGAVEKGPFGAEGPSKPVGKFVEEVEIVVAFQEVNFRVLYVKVMEVLPWEVRNQLVDSHIASFLSYLPIE